MLFKPPASLSAFFSTGSGFLTNVPAWNIYQETYLLEEPACFYRRMRSKNSRSGPAVRAIEFFSIVQAEGNTLEVKHRSITRGFSTHSILYQFYFLFNFNTIQLSKQNCFICGVNKYFESFSMHTAVDLAPSWWSGNKDLKWGYSSWSPKKPINRTIKKHYNWNCNNTRENHQFIVIIVAVWQCVFNLLYPQILHKCNESSKQDLLLKNDSCWY